MLLALLLRRLRLHLILLTYPLRLETFRHDSQSSSSLMAPDEAISNAQSLATGSVGPIAKSQPVVSINVDTTKTFVSVR